MQGMNFSYQVLQESFFPQDWDILTVSYNQFMWKNPDEQCYSLNF